MITFVVFRSENVKQNSIHPFTYKLLSFDKLNHIVLDRVKYKDHKKLKGLNNNTVYTYLIAGSIGKLSFGKCHTTGG